MRLQWDPDHDPCGEKLAAGIQLGLRGEAKSYADEWIVSIEDISDFVRVQHAVLTDQGLDFLMTPREEVYPVKDPQVRQRLGVDL